MRKPALAFSDFMYPCSRKEKYFTNDLSQMILRHPHRHWLPQLLGKLGWQASILRTICKEVEREKGAGNGDSAANQPQVSYAGGERGGWEGDALWGKQGSLGMFFSLSVCDNEVGERAQALLLGKPGFKSWFLSIPAVWSGAGGFTSLGLGLCI